jgi:hypothetical protein
MTAEVTNSAAAYVALCRLQTHVRDNVAPGRDKFEDCSGASNKQTSVGV